MKPYVKSITDAVRDASKSQIDIGFATIGKRLSTKHIWLDANNKYANDTIKSIKSDINDIDLGDFTEYMAASVIMHCFDGWVYLSRAIECLLQGDYYNAIHLGYYGELRAVMSFLASEGIGIFDRQHLCLDTQCTLSLVDKKPTTHGIAQTALESWCYAPNNGTRLLQLLNVDNYSFSDWLNAAGFALGGPAFPAVAKKLLLSWCLDIDLYKQDQAIRNDVSYRLHDTIPTSDQFLSSFSLLKTMWDQCSPITSLSTSELNYILLSFSIKNAYHEIYNKLPTELEYINKIDIALDILSPNNPLSFRNSLISAFTESNNPIFINSMKEAKLSKQPVSALPVICRAFLFLRLASAALKDIIERSPLTPNHLSSWWKGFGGQTGIWEENNPPSQISDIYDDILDSIFEFESLVSTHSSPITPYQVKNKCSSQMLCVSSLAPAGLWAIGL